MTNYIRWSRAVKMYLGGKFLLVYIGGSVVEPDVTDTRHAEWKAYHMMVMKYSEM